mmetsp:Transcript_17255/g.36257  ORF Transcript_17255/g.36257 Transcript_17255/m.36257 type:complete len:486 (+) Transcript_17255:195-1652(+)
MAFSTPYTSYTHTQHLHTSFPTKAVPTSKPRSFPLNEGIPSPPPPAKISTTAAASTPQQRRKIVNRRKNNRLVRYTKNACFFLFVIGIFIGTFILCLRIWIKLGEMTTDNGSSSMSLEHSRQSMAASTSSIDTDVVGEGHPMEVVGQNKHSFDAIAVVETAGELGNHLQYLNAGLELQEYLSETTGISVGLMIQQSRGQLYKSPVVHRLMERCFPSLAKTFGMLPPSRDPGALAWKTKNASATFPLDKKQRDRWLNARLPLKNHHDGSDENYSSAFFTRWPRNDTSPASPILPIVAHVEINSNPMKRPPPKRLREFYHLDEERCCPLVLPGTNVTVLHVRGFSTELSQALTRERGLQELDPYRAASQLLGHLRAGIDEVWIVARFEKDMLPYEDALSLRGIRASKVMSSDPMHDFCILQHAEGVAGIGKSTFLKWALRLNENLRRADVYAMYPKGGVVGKKRKIACKEIRPDDRVVCHEFQVNNY